MALALPSGYRYVRTLGAGGTAYVHLIYRERDKRYLALKLPLETTTPENFQRLAYRESEVTLRLRHPGVAQTELLCDSITFYGLVMPYLAGPCLATLPEANGVKRAAPPSEMAVVNFMSAIAILLYYLELKGCTHGDLKPHNIFLPREMTLADCATQALFFPRVIDFSMALLAGEPPQCRLGVGTMGYAAPETIRSGELSHQSDIFSLGVIAYMLATGAHPFISDKGDPAEIGAAVRELLPPQIHEINPSISTELSQLIHEMMAKEPGLRPQTGSAICERLAGIGATYPYTRAIRPRHLIGRHPERDFCDLLTIRGLTLPNPDHLYRLSGGDINRIEMILEANFDSRALVWREGSLVPSPGFTTYTWPRLLRHWEQKTFAQLRYSDAKDVVLSAVAGGCDKYVEVDLARGRQPHYASLRLAQVELIRNCISERTRVRESLRMANDLSHSARFENCRGLCAALYIQGKNLARGAELALAHCADLATHGRDIEALPLLTQAQHLARELKDHGQLAQLLHRDADIRKNIGDMIGAEGRYKRIIEIGAHVQTELLAETYKDLGDIYKLKQDFTSGLAALLEAKQLYEQLNNVAELTRVTNNIGNIYWIRADFAQALSSYRHALALHRKRGDTADISSTVSNIGSIYATTGRTSRATRMFTISLAMKREVGNQAEIARTLNNLGYTYHRVGDMPHALAALREALEINRMIGSRKEMLYNLDNLVSCAITAGRLGESLELIAEGRDLAEELHDHATAAAFDVSRAVTWKRQGRWRRAVELLENADRVVQSNHDRSQETIIYIHRADLAARMFDKTNATTFANHAREVAKEIGDRQAEIYAILANPTSTIAELTEAMEIAHSAHAARDMALVALAFAERNFADSQRYFTEAKKYFADAGEDIELPRFWRMVASRESEPLSERLIVSQDSVDLARASGDVTEEWRSLIVSGEALMQAEEFERGYAALARAMTIVKNLTQEIPDKVVARNFVTQPEIQHLATLIKTLHGRVGAPRATGN